MKKLAILGASGHGKVVADIAECCGWEVAFFDDSKPLGFINLTWPVLGSYQDLIAQLGRFEGVVVAVGNNAIRLARSRSLRDEGASLVTLTHPSACVSRYARMEAGSVIMPSAVINAGARVGLACIVNTGASIDHDCVLADGVHISPGARLAGEVVVGEHSWIGIGASIRQQICIGANAMVAAGAVVVKAVEDNATVAGVPAIRMR